MKFHIEKWAVGILSIAGIYTCFDNREHEEICRISSEFSQGYYYRDFQKMKEHCTAELHDSLVQCFVGFSDRPSVKDDITFVVERSYYPPRGEKAYARVKVMKVNHINGLQQDEEMALYKLYMLKSSEGVWKITRVEE